ncbi:hypothetical protein GCM10023196_037070 [Actinoallomurus vinaceus]|uniref:Uncharacterized protein n=1 Tax=Actinoallomurus vinaceus TaxID=1080074 RepID=A0ABP8UCY7_9ACTN
MFNPIPEETPVGTPNPLPNPFSGSAADFPAFTTAAIAMHEMFLAYLRAGFTEDQAIKLLVGFGKA